MEYLLLLVAGLRCLALGVRGKGLIPNPELRPILVYSKQQLALRVTSSELAMVAQINCFTT